MSQGSTPKTCAVCSVSKKNPATIRKPQVTNPDRTPPPRLFVLFVIHGIRSVRYAAEEIVKRHEHDGDVPAPGKAFDEAKEVALPTQKFESR